MMYRTVTVEPKLNKSTITVSVSAPSVIEATPEFYTKIRTYKTDVDPYTGAYEWTPNSETQTIEISQKLATRNITINPIPQNYGLISWNGAVMTVS